MVERILSDSLCVRLYRLRMIIVCVLYPSNASIYISSRNAVMTMTAASATSARLNGAVLLDAPRVSMSSNEYSLSDK